MDAVEPTLRLEWRTADELADNVANWRRHPEAQKAALEEVIARVGWAGALLLNERLPEQGWPEDAEPTLIDGHLRKDMGVGDELLPVLVGSWTSEDEALILASLDPIADAAEPDFKAFKKLTSGMKVGKGLGGIFEKLVAEGEQPEEKPKGEGSGARMVTCPECGAEFGRGE